MIKHGEITSQSDAAFKFCSDGSRKHHAQVALSRSPKLLSAEVQLSFGGSMDWDLGCVQQAKCIPFTLTLK